MVKIHRFLFVIFIIYATILELFNDGGKNLLVIVLIPIILVTILLAKEEARKQLFVKDYLPILVFAGYYLISTLINIQAFRLSSLAYSLNLSICFLLFYHLIRKYINLSNYKKWLIFIIALFFIALVIQHIGILLGVTNFFNRLSTIKYDVKENFLFSLNSLATEPSYASTTISICLFSFLKIRSAENHHRYSFMDFKRDVPFWLMYFYQLVFYRSVFGILFFAIILFQLINLRRIKNWLFLFTLVGFLMLINIDFAAWNRLKNISQGFDAQNLADFWQIDHSGSMRVLPLYHYIVHFNPSNIYYYIGFGLDYSQNYIRALIPGIPDDVAFGGLIPSLIFDFGVIGFLLLWRMILKFSISNLISIETILMLLVMVNATLNTQLFWFVLIAFSINRIVINQITTDDNVLFQNSNEILINSPLSSDSKECL